MQEITLSASKSQQFSVTLDSVSCTIKVHQRTSGLYLDLWVGSTAVCLGVLCLNANKIVRYDYLRSATGFSGDLFFIDTQGSDAPEYSELGTRYLLYYVTNDELDSASS